MTAAFAALAAGQTGGALGDALPSCSTLVRGRVWFILGCVRREGLFGLYASRL
jgi:hypothetical protein